MPWGVAAGLISTGVAAYGANKQAGAARDAAGQQQQTASEQMGLDANVFNAQSGMQLPTRELGGLAQSRLAFLMGLSPNLDISPDFATPNINPNPGSGAGLTWNGPSSGYGWNNTGAGNPNQPTMQPTTYNGLTPQFGTNSGGAQGPMFPSAGGAPSGGFGLPSAPGQGGFGSLGNPYDPSTFYQDPGYNFIKQQTQEGLDRAGASSGQLGSGSQLKAAMGYASGLASQEFNNAFNRSVTSQNLTYGMLTGLTSSGNQATNATGAAASNLGTMGSSALAGFGNAGAAGTIGAGNAWGSGFNQIGNSLTTLGMNYMNNRNQTPPNSGMYFPNSPEPAFNQADSPDYVNQTMPTPS